MFVKNDVCTSLSLVKNSRRPGTSESQLQPNFSSPAYTCNYITTETDITYHIQHVPLGRSFICIYDIMTMIHSSCTEKLMSTLPHPSKSSFNMSCDQIDQADVHRVGICAFVHPKKLERRRSTLNLIYGLKEYGIGVTAFSVVETVYNGDHFAYDWSCSR